MTKPLALTTAIFAVLVVFAVLTPHGALIIYNHSPSMPIGLYLRTGDRLRRGAIVTVRARDVAPIEARARRFDTAEDFFIKRITAMDGDLICASAFVVTIDGRRAAAQRALDSTGHPLRRWDGCHVLRSDEVFLLGDSADSFDARYWGPIKRDRIQGTWRPLF